MLFITKNEIIPKEMATIPIRIKSKVVIFTFFSMFLLPFTFTF